jgi:MFS transporter, DHA1 family, inner membrane transport protein
MAYFANRNVNRIYIHAALQAFATYGGEAFAFVYLLKAGIPAPIVLLAIAAMFGSRMLFRTLVLPLVRRVGLRRALILAILAEAATYPILSQITGTGPLLVVYLGLWAFSSSFYWTTYHAYVALLGDNHARGAQTSAVELIGMVMGIAAPAVTGLLLTAFSPIVAFGSVAVAMAFSALPVLTGPDPKIEDQAEMPPETRRAARVILFADGLRSGSFHFTWLIALFLTLGSSFAAYGGAMALTGLAGALGALVLGRAIDLGSGLVAVRIGFAALTVAAVARVIGWPVPALAIGANVAVALAWPLYATAFNSRVYTLARQSPCTLRFHIVAEGGWDMGTALSCLIAAALLQAGFGYSLPLSIGVLACGLGYLTIARTFAPAR